MIVDVTNLFGVKFRNRGEEESSYYDFFLRKNTNHPEPANISIVYGENGSGKSTLARSISEATRSEMQITFFGKDHSDLPSTDLMHNNIFVFNEEYISENIQVKEDENLKNIVLFGDDIELDAKLHKLCEEHKQDTDDLEKIEDKISHYENKIKEIKNEIRKELLLPDGWVERERAIRSSEEHITKIDESFIEELLNRELLPMSHLQYRKKVSEFTNKLEGYKKFPDHHSAPGPIELTDPYPIGEIVELLSTIPEEIEEKSEVSDIRERIIARKTSIDELREIESRLSTEEKFCPTCFRDISNDYREMLRSLVKDQISIIEKVGNNKKILDRICDIKLPDVELYEPALREEQYNALKYHFKRIKEVNHEINDLIRKKAKNPFVKIEYSPDEWVELIEGFPIIWKVNQRSSDYWSDNKSRLEEFEKELVEDNLILASIEVASKLKEYQEMCSEFENTAKRIEKLRESMEIRDREINSLKDMHLNVAKAADQINYYLQLIFSENRLSIKVNDGQYVVHNYWGPICPSRLSTGERNVLALCYFFVSIANNQRYEDALSLPSLIVLDDPISSFDFNNKYGMLFAICNFSRYALDRSKNATKILIFTHDLASAYELDNLMSGIDHSGIKTCYRLLENGVEYIDFETFDHYQKLLEESYFFACRKDDKLTSNFTANKLRRMFEAYSTFELRMPVTTVLECDVVKSALESAGSNERSYRYLSNFALRAFIHRDSHAKSQIYHGNLILAPSLSEDKLRVFARDILCLMYIVSRNHIVARLKSKNGGVRAVTDRFDEWLSEIASSE